MIIQFGRGDESAYDKWADGAKLFVSKPHFKIVFNNGLGFYILNSFKFNLLPKFYATFQRTFYELGVRFAGWTFEIMWSKAFKK